MSHCILQPFQPQWAGLLLSWIESAEACLRWAGPGLGWPLSPSKLRQYQAQATLTPLALTRVEDSDQASLDSDSLLGYLELLARKPDEIRLCRVICSPKHRGKGLGRELMRQGIERAFADPKVTHLSLAVFHDNLAARRCYQALGFEIVARGQLAATETNNFPASDAELLEMQLQRRHWFKQNEKIF
jgi:ribosomal protein S18 acetylase RimI-like enzyme